MNNTCVEFRMWSTHNDLFVFVCEAMSLGVSGLVAKQGECKNMEALTNMEGFRNSARELLHRIDLLEKRQAKVRHTLTHMATVYLACTGSVVTLIVCLC